MDGGRKHQLAQPPTSTRHKNPNPDGTHPTPTLQGSLSTSASWKSFLISHSSLSWALFLQGRRTWGAQALGDFPPGVGWSRAAAHSRRHQRRGNPGSESDGPFSRITQQTALRPQTITRWSHRPLSLPPGIPLHPPSELLKKELLLPHLMGGKTEAQEGQWWDEVAGNVPVPRSPAGSEGAKGAASGFAISGGMIFRELRHPGSVCHTLVSH